MKPYFATNVQGSEICWKKFISAAKFYEVEVLILGSDMTGKAIVPIFEMESSKLPCWTRNQFWTGRIVSTKWLKPFRLAAGIFYGLNVYRKRQGIDAEKVYGKFQPNSVFGYFLLRMALGGVCHRGLRLAV